MSVWKCGGRSSAQGPAPTPPTRRGCRAAGEDPLCGALRAVCRKIRPGAEISYPEPVAPRKPPSPSPLGLWALLAIAPACATSQATADESATPGDLVASRTDVSSWSPAEQTRIREAQPHVQAAAKRFGVDPNLINGFIWVESKFEARARGPGGAAGLMQLMPSTSRDLAKQLGERSRPYDPEFNVRAGTYYLSRLLKRFDGDVRFAIAAYQAGPGTASKWKKAGKGLPKSSQAYVDKVLAAKRRFDGR